MTDSQKLLAEYVESGSEAAFRELVSRYLGLVYSAAIRVLQGDAHLAEDVAQNVFAELARTARTLSKDTMVGGWLHRHTCFVAANTMRGERRRRSRERQAVEMNALQDRPEGDLSLIAPILDEAINQLDEADRRAILLRFFERHDFRSVGAALGSSEDAARMRVTRALEKLRSMLKSHGVSTSAAGLAVALWANAIQAAPVGLAATISTAIFAETMIHSATVGAVTRLIAMTTIQKSIIAATVVAAVGTGIYQAHQASTLRAEVQTLEGRQAPLAEHIQQLQRERDDATNRLASLAQEIRNNTPVDSAILQGYQIIPGIYLGNDVNDLGDWAITQKAVLDDHDALRVAIGTSGIVDGYRAETDSALDAPIKAFAAANNGHLPKNIYDLKPYVATPAEQAAFQKRIILDSSAPPPSSNPIQGGGFPIRYQ